MAELDNLLGSKISLISQQDVRYEGILFSINQTESSIVLQNGNDLFSLLSCCIYSLILFSLFIFSVVLCYGTEDRPTPKAVAATSALIPFVSFPGNEIKDLFVHEEIREELPAPPVNSKVAQTQSDNKQQNRSLKSDTQKQKPLPKPRNFNPPPAPATSAGTGEHLLKLKERTAGSSSAIENPVGEFDFESGLTSFKKEEVLAEVAEEANSNGILSGKYIKDNFFDTLSSSVDSETSRKDRLTAGEERVLNQDTFGAIALQQNHHRRGGHRGGRGGGRGGSSNYRGRGNGRGGYNNSRGDGNTRRGRGGGYGNRQATKTGSD